MFNKHRPLHIYLNDQIYFITANTYGREKHFQNCERRELIRGILLLLNNRYKLSLYAWVILEEHYHLLLKVPLGGNLVHFIQKFHSDIALLINSLDKVKGRKVIYQYWDKCVSTDKEFWTRFNYIHHNPVKHNLTDKMEFYPFSSYRHYLEKNGQPWLDSCFRLYPIVDYSEASHAKLTFC